MTTAITLFDNPMPVPSYLQNNAVAAALQQQMEGGLAGRQINRISLRNGKFRFSKAGVEVAVWPNPTLDVVIVAANPAVGRLYYSKPFDSAATGERPDCYSREGKVPEADSPAKQSELCATCKQNAVGSALNGKGRACSFKKRVVITAPGKIDGDAYAIDIAAMGLFGEDLPTQKLFNLRSYIEALKVNGLIVPAVVTRLSFDDAESVPKLYFTPVRVLTEAEFNQVSTRIEDPAVRDMLDDVDNKTEVGKPAPAIAAPAAAAPAAPAQPAVAMQPAAPAQPVAQQPAPQPVQRRARTPKTEAPPAQVQGAPAAAAPAAATVEGFGAPAPAAAPPPAAQQAPAAVPGFSIDLDEFDK